MASSAARAASGGGTEVTSPESNRTTPGIEIVTVRPYPGAARAAAVRCPHGGRDVGGLRGGGRRAVDRRARGGRRQVLPRRARGADRIRPLPGRRRARRRGREP